SEEHTSELQSRENLVCRLLLENKNCASRSACRKRMPPSLPPSERCLLDNRPARRRRRRPDRRLLRAGAEAGRRRAQRGGAWARAGSDGARARAGHRGRGLRQAAAGDAFFFPGAATPEIYTLSLHAALPI